MKQPSDVTLAIDPGLRELGFAVLDREALVAHGVLPLKLLPRAKRAPEARKALNRWLAWYRPRIVVLEVTHAHPEGVFQEVHHLTRSLAAIACRHRRTVVSYSPQTVRKYLVGNGRAEKGEVALVVADRFPELRPFLTQDRVHKVRYFQNLFDAAALALYHRQSR